MLAEFLRAIYSSWGSGVTGTASAPLFVVALVTSGVPRYVSGAFSVMCLLAATYIVWKKEREKVIQLEGRPEVSFTILRIGGTVDAEYLFQFFNASESTAINVSLAPISTRTLAFEFVPIGSLVKSPAPTNMEYRARVGDAPAPAQEGNRDMLRLLSLGGKSKQTCYDTKLEFSNYGDVSRWQVAYRLECDHESKKILPIPGECRRLR